jgi:glycosyltransferase involved in cell wall biosynthesis
MLGYGWFPDRLGGLNRYYRELLEHLPEASGVVIGDAGGAPVPVAGVSNHDAPLPARLVAFWRAAQEAASASEVVDAHFALYALAPLRIGRLRRKPVIVHFHGPWADESAAGGDVSLLRRHARRLLERAAYQRATESVVLTSAFRRVLVERYGARPWTVNVVPPGVDLDRFMPAPDQAEVRRALGLPERGFVAVCVRRLVPRMGVEVLLDAWERALPDLPLGSVLVVAGDGPLRAGLAAALGADGSIRLLGRVTDEDLVRLYQAADVAVVPSLAHEGFGLVVLEAAACGAPSVVTDVGGLPEAIAGLDESLIVPPGDADALAERLRTSVVSRPSAAATRAYAERFGWDAVAARHRMIARRTVHRARTVPAAERGEARLRVVYLDHVARLSGGEIALLRLLPHLDRVDPHVILAEDGPLVGALHRECISSEVLPMAEVARDLRKGEVRRGGVSIDAAAATSAYVLRLAARLRYLKPDLVHTNSLKAGLYGSLAARLAGIPMIWHVRDRIAEDYLPVTAVRLIRQMIRRLATAVVANSRTTLETLGPGSNPVMIYSVVPEVLSEVPIRERSAGGPLTFGVVGRLAPWKGQDLFLRAFARAFPDGDERAVIVGGALFGEDEFATALPGLAGSLGIDGRVELRGHRPDIWSELSRLDVLVHTSRTPEPFGQVVLEGMAARVPVIAAGAGGPAEILEHDVTGILYEPDDEGALADSMCQMTDPALRERLAAAARGSLGPYSPAVVADQLQQVYAAVAARRLSRLERVDAA